MSDTSDEQHVRQQARRILHAFRTHDMSLAQIVDDLNVLWGSLAESEWSEQFRGHWWTLEQVYAVALDRDEIDALPDDALRDIEEAVTALERLVEAQASRS